MKKTKKVFFMRRRPTHPTKKQQSVSRVYSAAAQREELKRTQTHLQTVDCLPGLYYISHLSASRAAPLVASGLARHHGRRG